MKIRLLLTGVALATLAACGSGGETLPTQAPTSASPTTSASASAPARPVVELHREEGSQVRDRFVVTQGDKLVCNPDPNLKLRAARLQVDGTIQFGNYQISTRTEGNTFKVIPDNGRYPKTQIMIVNNNEVVTLPNNFFSGVFDEGKYPTLLLTPAEFGGKIESLAFCTSES